MSNLVTAAEFLDLSNRFPVIDVRSPSEFEQGHIPGAYNLALFDDNERAIVGTLFKKKGKTEAVLKGLDFAGKKTRKLAETGIKLSSNKQVLIHCWRGGMRSASVAWLLETCGLQCHVLKGGYKTFRNHIRSVFSLPIKFIVIGGMTGSGKSAILDEIEKLSFQVLKLEEIARHKGSVFGWLGELPQNTNEQFENDLFAMLTKMDFNKPVFIEDESRNIGKNIIPPELFVNMSLSCLVVLDLGLELRIGRLVNDYGIFPKTDLRNCIEKLSKRLGGVNLQTALTALEEGKTAEAARISLLYYDKAYTFGLSKKKNSPIVSIPVVSPDAKTNAKLIIDTLIKDSLI